MRHLLCALLIFLTVIGAESKTKKSRDSSAVRKEQTQVKQEIGKTQKQIDENRRVTANKLNQLNSLNSQIASTNENIASINRSIADLTAHEAALNDSIKEIEVLSEKLKSEYAKSLREDRRRHKSLSGMGLVFSAESFNSAVKRSSYLRQLKSTVDEKATALKGIMQDLADKRDALTQLKNKQQELLANLAAENKKLTQQKNETQALVGELQKEASTLKDVLRQKQQLARSLDAELNRIIEQEARAEAERRERERREAEAKRKAEEQKRQAELKAEQERRDKELAQEKAAQQNDSKSKKDKKKDKKDNKKDKTQDKQAPAKNEVASTATTPTSSKSADAPTVSKPVNLTGSFESNKGKLLFPIAGKYSIVGTFGVQQHKDLPYVQTQNTGIDIETSQGAVARAVFDGEVSTIFFHEGYQNIVMVRHGEYLTIYANIDKLSVKKGDKLKAGQTIGQVYSDSHDGNRTILHFEVRKEKQKLNPLEWVRR